MHDMTDVRCGSNTVDSVLLPRVCFVLAATSASLCLSVLLEFLILALTFDLDKFVKGTHENHITWSLDVPVQIRYKLPTSSR